MKLSLTSSFNLLSNSFLVFFKIICLNKERTVLEFRVFTQARKKIMKLENLVEREFWDQQWSCVYCVNPKRTDETIHPEKFIWS